MQYDVVVCGLGSAGFTAAVAAARQGAKTAVLEKEFTPGGILTIGGNCAIDQFNNPFKSGDKMVIKGIGLEFVKKLEELGFSRIVGDETIRILGFAIKEYYIFKFIATVFVTIMNFIASKLIIFRKGQRQAKLEDLKASAEAAESAEAEPAEQENTEE